MRGRKVGAQNFALFLSLSLRKIRSFLPSLGVFSWNFGGVSARALKCARLEFSGCRSPHIEWCVLLLGLVEIQPIWSSRGPHRRGITPRSSPHIAQAVQRQVTVRLSTLVQQRGLSAAVCTRGQPHCSGFAERVGCIGV